MWGVGIGLSTGFVGGYLAAFIAARWFHAREGLVVGLLTAANAAGQLVFLPTMAQLATDAGWRVMSLVLAGTVIAFLPVLMLFMRDRPEELGLARYGEEAGARPAALPGGNPVAVAFRALATGVRSRDFWLIAGGYFVCGATTNGLIGTHLIAACVDHGLSEVAGAGLLAATGRLRAGRRDDRRLAQRPLGQPAAVVRLLRFARPVVALSAVRLRHAVLRPVGIQRHIWARLDRQRAADRAPVDRRRRRRADRHHGRLDHRDPPDRQRLGGLSRRPVCGSTSAPISKPSFSPGSCCWRRP